MCDKYNGNNTHGCDIWKSISASLNGVIQLYKIYGNRLWGQGLMSNGAFQWWLMKMRP